jgi:hypothetical protein
LYRQESGKNFCFSVLFDICPNTGSVANGKNFCYGILRATFVLAFYHQNANAKSEFVTIRANMSEAVA